MKRLYWLAVCFVILNGLMLNSAAVAAEKNSIYSAVTSAYKEDNSDEKKAKSVTLSDFKGKKVVFSMIYTSCQHACPLMMKKLEKISEKLKQDKVNVEFVVVSFDTVHDSPKKLAAFRKHYPFAGSNWHFLVGDEKSTRLLANIVEINYSVNPDDQSISHDNKVVLLDETGVIVRTLEGLTTDKLSPLF